MANNKIKTEVVKSLSDIEGLDDISSNYIPVPINQGNVDDSAKISIPSKVETEVVGSLSDIADIKPNTDKSPGIPESLGLGAAQGASLGLYDELVGLGTAVRPEGRELRNQAKDLYSQQEFLSNLANKMGAPNLAPPPVDLPRTFGEQYVSGRDFARKQQEDAQKANPGSHFIGEMVGSIGPGMLSGGSVPLLAAEGAGSGAGYSKADLTKGEVGDFAKDVGLGAAIGGGSGAVLKYGTPAAKKKISSFVERRAQRNAGRSLDPFTTKSGKIFEKDPKNWVYNADGEAIAKKEQITRIGKELLDSGEFKAIATPKKLEIVVKRAYDKVAKSFDDLFNAVHSQTNKKADGNKIVSDIVDYASTLPESETARVNKLMKIAELDYEGKVFNLDELNNLKAGYKYTESKSWSQTADDVNALKRIIGKNMDDFVENNANNHFKQYKKIKQQYGILKPALDMAIEQSTKYQGKSFLRRTLNIQNMAGLAFLGITTGNPAIALTALGGKVAFDIFGQPIRAKLYQSIAKNVVNKPTGNKSAMLTNYLMGKKQEGKQSVTPINQEEDRKKAINHFVKFKQDVNYRKNYMDKKE